MGNVQGIGGLPGAVVIAPASGNLGVQVQAPVFQPADGVAISKRAAQLAAAREAAANSRSLELSQQRIDELRARLQEGAYKLQAALLKVASRVAPHVQ